MVKTAFGFVPVTCDFSMALTSTTLFESAELRVRHVHCCAEHAQASGIEYSASETLVLPLRGAFRKHFGARKSMLVTPSMALFFARDRPHRISHPCGLEDECLALDFNPSILDATLVDAAGVDRFGHPGLREFAVLPLRAIAARELLALCLKRREVAELNVVEIAVHLLGVASALATNRQTDLRQRETTQRRRAEMIEMAKHLLAHANDRLTLTELAARVHTTPFHLARVFREKLGISIHDYQVRLRLSQALNDVLDSSEPFHSPTLQFVPASPVTVIFPWRSAVMSA